MHAKILLGHSEPAALILAPAVSGKIGPASGPFTGAGLPKPTVTFMCNRHPHSMDFDDSPPPRLPDYNTLPPELWQEVVCHLPRSSQRACLSVSRAFHALALRLVFTDVTVYFGAWDTWDAEAEETDQDANALEDERSSRSFDLLHRIIADPLLANSIRELEVHAFKVDGKRGIFEIRELLFTVSFIPCLKRNSGYLMDAISCMHELTSLVWHGNAPLPTAGVIHTLAQSCKLLRNLSVP